MKHEEMMQMQRVKAPPRININNIEYDLAYPYSVPLMYIKDVL